MRAVEILLNGKLLCILGAPNALMLSARVILDIEGPAIATLWASGMNDLGDERQSHTHWLEDLSLSLSDSLVFRFAEVAQATPPEKEVATDSEEHLAEQRCYEEDIKQDPPKSRLLDRNLEGLLLEVSIDDIQRGLATFNDGREFMSFSLLWNQWRPDSCRITLSAYSMQEALERNAQNLLTESIAPGQCCCVRISG